MSPPEAPKADAQDIHVRSYVFNTGQQRRGSHLIPIEAVGDTLPYNAGVLEGSIELTVGGTVMLARDEWLYVDLWWDTLITACEAMIAGRPFEDALGGTVVIVGFEPLPNSRRTRVTARLARPRSDASFPRETVAHTPTLVKALLRGALDFAQLVRHDCNGLRGAEPEIERLAAAARHRWTPDRE